MVNSSYIEAISFEQAEKVFNNLQYHFWPLIGTSNQVAIQSIYEAIDLMEEVGWIKQAIKPLVRRAERCITAYEQRMRAAHGDRFFLIQDLATRASHKLEHDVFNLYMAIKQTLDRNNIPDSKIRSKVNMSCTLLELSIEFFNSTVGYYQQQTPIDIKSVFLDARLDALCRTWNAINDNLPKFNGFVDLNKDDNIKLSMKVILAKYQRADFLNEAAREALQLNPDMAKYAAPEDLHVFNKT